jgi:hypothetical protein
VQSRRNCSGSIEAARLGTIGEKTDQSELQLSPDGTRVLVSVLDPSRQTCDIWIHDLTRDYLGAAAHERAEAVSIRADTVQ